MMNATKILFLSYVLQVNNFHKVPIYQNKDFYPICFNNMLHNEVLILNSFDVPNSETYWCILIDEPNFE